MCLEKGYITIDNTIIQLYYCTMKWITTNIRFPEDMYMELKMEAAKRRSSVAEVVREKVAKKKGVAQKRNVEKIMAKLEKLAAENARQNPGISFSEKLIEMRYEQ